MIIDCPYCGTRDHSEFSYGRDASFSRPESDEVPNSDWCAYIYDRANPMGPHLEYWQHIQGCRQWLKIHRNTLNGKIKKVELMGPFSSSGEENP
ncbi:MAG: sarcosine oxidase subunit delta [Gammaproteobacteria bacterium]